MAWSAVLGAVAGAGGSMLGDVVSNAYGQHNAKVAFRRQKTILKNQIQWRVKDLLKAGLNPQLAVSGGLGGGGASVQQAQAQEFDPSLGAAKGAEAVMQVRQGIADIGNTNAMTAKAVQDTATSKAAAEKAAQDVVTGQAQARAFDAQAGEAAQRGAREAAETGAIPRRLEQEIARSRAEASAANARAARDQAETEATKAGWFRVVPEKIRNTALGVNRPGDPSAEESARAFVRKIGEGLSHGAQSLGSVFDVPSGPVGSGPRRLR